MSWVSGIEISAKYLVIWSVIPFVDAVSVNQSNLIQYGSILQHSISL